jgi:hypothetical protein
VLQILPDRTEDMHGGKATDKCLELLSKGFKNLRHIDLQQVENVTTRGLIRILHPNLYLIIK